LSPNSTNPRAPLSELEQAQRQVEGELEELGDPEAALATRWRSRASRLTRISDRKP
jgi:hypothetical protein